MVRLYSHTVSGSRQTCYSLLLSIYLSRLLAATLGPLANVLSIGALVTPWRMSLVPQAGQTTVGNAQFLAEVQGNLYVDPHWYVYLCRRCLMPLTQTDRCYWLNVISLITGFVGNFFLLFNFAKRIRYIIALPMTIISWYFATVIVGIVPYHA